MKVTIRYGCPHDGTSDGYRSALRVREGQTNKGDVIGKDVEMPRLALYGAPDRDRANVCGRSSVHGIATDISGLAMTDQR